MKKMLAKAVVLGLVLGGIGFVANDALAAEIGNGVKVHSAGTHYNCLLYTSPSPRDS